MRTAFASAFATLAATIAVTAPEAAAVEIPDFVPQVVDSKVVIGYGVAIGDVDGDGKPDILLADKKQFVWYQNPDWKRHVLVENLTKHDNVCLAARDIDGDGKVEVAVGAEWNPGDTEHSGSVHYLIPPEDRRQKWTPVKLHHEPTVHRMRWVRLENDKFVLVVAPLHGRGNRNGQGEGVRLLAYEIPADPRDEWKTTLLDNSLHVTHNFERGQWYPDTEAEEILYLGREGARLIFLDDGQWKKKPLPDIKGGGEIRLGRLGKSSAFIATIEPFHGTELVLYEYHRREDSPSFEFTARHPLDDNLQQGHAVAAGDLFGIGNDQIVAGWRNPNREGKVGVKVYYTADVVNASAWRGEWIDEGEMATEDLRIADLDGDGRLDIIAAGRSTHNLKIYWNR